MKKLFSIFMFVILLTAVGVMAQETAYPELIDEDNLFEGYEDETLEVDAGITPEDAFYFIDKFFDRFGDDLTVKEEKIAEIKEMIEAGNIEAAKEILEDYRKLADELEKEINPERREEAKRSSAAIRNSMKDIRDILPPGERGEFVSEIMSKEHSIATSAEIASKIKDLCTQLAEIDPLEYSRMCKTDDDAPRWQRDLDRDLTEDQEKIAREFVGIMKDCFKTSGQDCRCEDIPFTDFSNACSQAAPLATACDIKGDERACNKLDELKMPELPDWLQPIWEDLEEGMMEAQYDMHMPKECVEAGVTNPKECGKIMIQTHAPEECKEALLAADIQNEREGREICDKIMFELHAPKECIDKGITDPEECRKFMDSFRRDEHFEGPRIDFDCKGIEDPMARLDCFDKASSQAQGFKGFSDEDYEGNCMTDSDWKAKKEECRRMYGEHAGDEPIMGDSGEGYECVVDAKCIDFSQGKISFEEIKQRERECASKCESNNQAWDFSYGECKCYGADNGPDFGVNCATIYCGSGSYCREGIGCVSEDGGQEANCDDCASKCESRPDQRLRGTDCVSGRCECYYESTEPQYDEGEGPSEPEEEFTQPVEPTSPEPEVESEVVPEPSEPVVESSPEPSEEPSSSEPAEESSTSETESEGITGNAFLDYNFK